MVRGEGTRYEVITWHPQYSLSTCLCYVCQILILSACCLKPPSILLPKRETAYQSHSQQVFYLEQFDIHIKINNEETSLKWHNGMAVSAVLYGCSQGPPKFGSDPCEKHFLWTPSKGTSAWGKSRKTKAESFVSKMAAGCHWSQHDRSLPNYVWHHKERQIYTQHSGAPGPFRTAGPSNL